MPYMSQEKRGGHRDRPEGFSGAREAQFRIQPFIKERKRAWLGAIPRAGSACRSLRLDPQGPSCRPKQLPAGGLSEDLRAPVFEPRLKTRDFDLSGDL